MKLLILEEDTELLTKLIKHLKKEGFLCEYASSYTEGLKKIISYHYDCILLDLQLSNGKGEKLTPYLRKSNPESGLIILAKEKETEQCVRSLHAGADDFMVKPIDFNELNARIRAVIRRLNYRSIEQHLRFDNLLIDADACELKIDNDVIELTKKEFQILLYLARNKNRIITKEAIAENLWGDHMEQAASFDFIYAHIKNLRKKLEANNCKGYVTTVYGMGYKFNA